MNASESPKRPKKGSEGQVVGEERGVYSQMATNLRWGSKESGNWVACGLVPIGLEDR